jgi:hypothetical protein
MDITSAKYSTTLGVQDNNYIECVIDGEALTVPAIAGNRHYDEIMKQVAAGDLTIADAD